MARLSAVVRASGLADPRTAEGYGVSPAATPSGEWPTSIGVSAVVLIVLVMAVARVALLALGGSDGSPPYAPPLPPSVATAPPIDPTAAARARALLIQGVRDACQLRLTQGGPVDELCRPFALPGLVLTGRTPALAPEGGATPRR